MQNEIQQAKEILEASNLFTAVELKGKKDFRYLKAHFRARDTGRLISSIKGAEKLVAEYNEQIAPFVVGQGCSVRYWSDVKACRVIWTSADGKRVKVQEDKATLLNGFKSGEKDALVMHPGGFMGHTEGSQRYDLQPNTEGSVHEFSLRKNGKWRAKGDCMRSPCKHLSKTHYHYYDYNF